MSKRLISLQILVIVSLVLGLPLPGVRAAAPGQVLPASRSAEGIPETYTLAAQNETFELYASAETLAFKVVDRRSGYIWHSNLDEVTKDDKLNKTWTAFARSGISIEYLDDKAVEKRASITNSKNEIDFQTTGQGFSATVNFVDPGISLTVVVSLGADGVSVEVPFDSIHETNPEFKLGRLHVYPFFGAVKEDTTPGYMFIPDGSGTLIRFGATTKARNMFYGRYYSNDLGMTTSLPWDPLIRRAYRISIPVTGMSHGNGEHAYIAIVEKGASYAEIRAHPAGVTTRFNFLYNLFIYNESYFQATNRSGAGVTTLQPATNPFDVRILYRFLTGPEGDIVGMAHSYQRYLLEKGALHGSAATTGDIGIRLEFLAAEKERVLFWNRPISMTTMEQMAEILADLNLSNPQVVYYGWQPLGASAMPPRRLRIEPLLGSRARLEELVAGITATGGSFALYLDPMAAFRDESGYSLRSDVAMSITNANLVGFNRFKVNYYFNLGAIEERYGSLSEDVFAIPGAGLALDNFPSTLYSDFKNHPVVTREEMQAGYRAILAAHPGPTAMYAPNDYLFEFMTAYYDIPISNSGYIYTSDVVPFLQIVLAGYVPYYGAPLNFSSNTRQDLLRMVDFGVYPSYFLSHDVTAKILNTDSSWIYTSSYSQWEQPIRETFAWMNSLLAPVKGQAITARRELASGVMATTYANGRQIIVNYTLSDYSAGGITVKAQDAILLEAAP